MKDKTQEWTHIWPQLSNDGHPSYCPTNNNLVVFDTYPSRSRIQEVKIGLDTDTIGDSVKVLARVFHHLNMIMILDVTCILVGVKTVRLFASIVSLRGIVVCIL